MESSKLFFALLLVCLFGAGLSAPGSAPLSPSEEALVQEPGTKVVTDADGSKKSDDADGSKKSDDADGSKKSDDADGSKKSDDAEGSKKSELKKETTPAAAAPVSAPGVKKSESTGDLDTANTLLFGIGFPGFWGGYGYGLGYGGVGYGGLGYGGLGYGGIGGHPYGGWGGYGGGIYG